jgi:hypothetical protein
MGKPVKKADKVVKSSVKQLKEKKTPKVSAKKQ